MNNIELKYMSWNPHTSRWLMKHFLFVFEPIRNPFSSKTEKKLLMESYLILLHKKHKSISLSVIVKATYGNSSPRWSFLNVIVNQKKKRHYCFWKKKIVHFIIHTAFLLFNRITFCYSIFTEPGSYTDDNSNDKYIN